ncbi:MAG: hypothetical protein ACD_29C00044G0002 [uncultured bacterium]|nr:MAG: hypothetical protein ACD_29C00044G0002 [uncultured bacterium]
MNLLKLILICSIFLIHASYALICVNTSSNFKMFGSVDLSNSLDQSFLMAFQNANFKNYKIFYTKNNADLMNQIQKMTSDQCDLILGLFTSQDCLIAGPILLNKKIVALSSSCSANNIYSYFPYIYTAVPKLSDFSKIVAQKINTIRKNDSVYVFYQPSDAYSYFAFNDFKKFLKRPVISIPVNTNADFDLTLLNINDNPVYFIFFTYPLPSAQILVTLSNHHLILKNTEIIGASSWVFDVSVFYPIKNILLSAGKVLAPNLIDRNTMNFFIFSKKFYKKYHHLPTTVDTLSYDAALLSITCYKKSFLKNQYNEHQFLTCIKQNHYVGISGKMIFLRHSPFAERKINLIDFTSWI